MLFFCRFAGIGNDKGENGGCCFFRRKLGNQKINAEFHLAQTTAITENGTQLILYKDKTWTYANSKDREAFKNIPVNNQLLTKSPSADSLVSSERADGGVYFDKKNGTLTKVTISDFLNIIL